MAGPDDAVEVYDPLPPSRRPRGLAIAHGAISLAVILGVPLYMLITGATLLSAAIGLGVMALYTLLGYFLRPPVDTNNLGWAGGLINNPFRFSDNVNRMMLFLRVALWPGGVLGRGLVGLVHASRDRQPELPPGAGS